MYSDTGESAWLQSLNFKAVTST